MSKSDGITRGLWPILGVLFIAEVISSLEGSMLFTAMPTIAREHGLTNSTWLITGYALVGAASAVLGSRLGDMYGRKRALLAVLAICSAGSVVSASASDLSWIVAGRMMQGVTGAILPLSFGIARVVSPPDRTAFSIGVLTGAWAGSAALGYVVGGVFAEHGHWQSLFWLTATLPVLAALGCAWILPADHREASGGRVDWLGAALLVPAIMLFQLGIGRGAHAGWDGLTLAQVVGGIVLLALWVLVELRVKSPLVDVRQLTHRKLILANVNSAFLGLGAMQLALVLMMLIQQPAATGIGFGVGATLAGLLKLPSNLVSLGTGPLAGHLAGRHGAKLPILCGALIMTMAWFGMAFIHGELWHIIAGTFLGAAGSSLIMASIPNLVVEVVPKGDTSAATGLTMVVRGVFTSIGAQMVALLLDSGHGSAPTDQAYMSAMLYIGAMSLAVFFTAVLIPTSDAAADADPAATGAAAGRRVAAH